MADPTCAQARAPEAAKLRPPWLQQWYFLAFAVVLVAYAALTVAVLAGSPIATFDGYVLALHIGGHHPQWTPLVNVLVIAGQRGPSTLVALPWFIWRAWRQRSLRPLVLLGTGLLLLNLSVGAVKIVLGRIGPRHTLLVHDFFHGGNIYPSGHVSNAVVLFGLLAWIAVRHRRAMVGVAIFVPVMVGACTVFLRTHWVSDIVAGWFAGGLVLMALPWVLPSAERCVDAAVRRVARWTHRPQLARLTADLPAGNAAMTTRDAAGAAPAGAPAGKAGAAHAMRHPQPRPRGRAPFPRTGRMPERLTEIRTVDHS